MARHIEEPSDSFRVIRPQRLDAQGGRVASEGRFSQAARLSAISASTHGKDGERYSLEQAEIQIKSLLKRGIARGPHMVISGRS